MRRRVLRFLCLFLGLLLTAAGAGPLLAQDNEPQKAVFGDEEAEDAGVPIGSALRFRRVLVPEDRIPEFAGKGFFPMIRREFEQLTQLLQRDADFPSEANGAALRSSYYYAAVSESEFLRGHAVWEIDRRRPGAAAVALAPLNLAISSPYWQETNTPAAAGSDELGRLVVLARREKMLAFSWSARGTRDPFGAVEYSLELPQSPVRRIVIDLPQEMVLRVRGGIAEEIEPAAADASLLNLAPADPGMRRWRIEALGMGQITVRAMPRTGGAEESVAALQQLSVYDLRPEGVTLAEELRLFVRGAPRSELWLRTPDELRLTAARLNDRAIDFEASPDDPRRVVLRFPEPIVGDRHLVRISARAPLELDDPWRLPAIRAENVQWRSGQAVLRMARSLVLAQISPRDCVHTQTAPLGSGESGQSLTFRNYTPESELVLTVSQRRAEVGAIAGTTVEFGPTSAAATAVFRLEAAEGERFLVAGSVAPDWIIDTVTAAVLKDGSPGETKENFTPTLENSGQEFVVRFDEPLRPRRSLQLSFKAHRRLSGENPALARADLRVIELRDVTENARYVAIQPEDPYQVVLSGDRDLARFDPLQLPADAGSLITTSRTALAMEDDGAAPGVRAQLVTAAPSVSASIAVEVRAGEDRVEERYQIRVLPVSSRIDQLHVHFSQRRDEPLSWRLEDSPDQTLSARRLEGDGLEEGETWELTFERSRDAPFTVVAERAMGFTGPIRLAFASLPQAAAQQGELTVYVDAGSAIDLRTGGMNVAPSPLAPAGESSSIYGVYAFDPAQQPAATMQLLRDPMREPGAWAWKHRLTSQYAVDGAAQHTAEFELENAGRESVLVQLPLGAALRRVEVNGAEIPLTLAALRANATPIPLPAGGRFPKLRVEFTMQAPRLAWWATAPMPSRIVDVPIVSREWIIVTAPGAAISALDDGVRICREDATWDKRLLGILRPGRSWLALDSQSGAKETSLPAEAVPAGWRAHRAMVAAARSPQVTLYRRDVVDLAAAALFVVATIMLAWLSARRAAWLWIVGGAASAAALAAPAPTFLIGTALFLSVLAAAVLRLATLLPIEPPVRQSRELTLSTVSFPNPLLLIAGLMLAASFLPLGPAHGQLAPFQPVLIPVDDQGRVSLRDKYVYLPESLYRGLRQSALRLDTAPRSWLLRSTDYEAVFGWGEGASSIECQRIAVELEFEVVAAPTTIKLPLAWRNIGLAQNSVRLDGAPIHLKWWDQEKSFSFAVNTAGVVRLSLEIEPRVVGDGSENRIEIPILPVADSTLKVRYPGRVERVEAPEVLGNFARDARTGEFSAEMGPADRLTIIWPESEERSVPARSQHVEQYAWLHIQPDAVVLDAKWKFLAGGPIEEVHVLADDNLTPLPSTAPGLAGFTQVRRDGRQSLRLQLDQPRTPPFDFQISFLVEGAVGVGRPAAPAIDLQNATPAQRRLAITYDPALKSENVATDGLEPLAVTQFRSEWGASSPAPQSAYRLLGDNFAWSAQTRLPDIPLGGEAQCDLVFRREEVRALYRANLELGKGHRLLLRAAAKGLRIQRVAVLEGGLNRVEHWSQSESGEVLAFLNGRVAGACQVEIDGQASIPLRGEIDLPQIELADSGAPATGYRIYGAPEVSLQITNLKGFTREEAEPLERYVADRGRLEGILQGDGSSEAAPAARIEMQPNRPRVVRKQLVTTLRPGASQWSFDLELQFQANQGVVDVVRFDLPQEVAEPLDVQPPARWELRDVGRPGRQLLVVRPESPLTGRTTLRVTGLLRQPPGEAVRAPAIEPLDFGEMPQFLVLPRRWRSQPLTWEVSGMRAEVIPGAAPEDLSVPATSYRVVNKPRHGAVLRRTENVVGDPRVRLMDVEMLLQSPSDYYATAVFALDPAGMNQCIFALPDEARLVHADMDGRAVSPTPLNGRRYAFDFERTRLNIRLSISYAGRIAPDDAGQFILPAPLLLDIPVDQSLWTVSSVAPNVTVRLASEVSRNRQNQLRLAALEEILQAPAATESAYTKPALAQLRGSWARRWIEALLGDAASTINAETALDTLDEDQRALVEQYELEPVLLEVIQAARQNKGLTDFAHQANSSRAALEGPGPVAMFVAADSSSLSAQYTVSAAVVFLIACLLAAGFRRVHEAEWLARFAPLLLVAAGLVWWTWLTPSGAGLLAVAAGLWLSLSRPARHSLPTPRSSIVNLPVRY